MVFWGGYLPSLSINYVAMSKDMGKRLPQLYYIKMKISYNLGFFCNRSRHGNVLTPLRFLFIFVFLCAGVFLRNRLREFVTAIIASIMAKFEQILCVRFRISIIFFINMTIPRSIVNKYALQVSRTLKTGKALNRASNITNFSPRFCVCK